MRKYFIGEDYKTIKEKNDILATYDDLQRAKLEFLNDMYDNENTLKNLWSIYSNHIHFFEEEAGKDAMFFNEVEVDEILANRFRYAQTTKTNIISFINIYKRWGVDRGDISGNSVEAIDRQSAVKDLSKVLINKVWGLGEFYNLMIEMETKSTIDNAIPLLLARYGIVGKELIEMRSLKWEDVDYDKKRVTIHQKNKAPKYLDVDDRFLEWIDKYKNNESYGDVTDFGYVLKKNNKARDDSNKENPATIHSKVYRACKDIGIPRIAFGDLLKSRYIDLLLDIRATRKLTTDDFIWVIANFKTDASGSSTQVLKNYYESLTKDKVIGKDKGGGLSTSLHEDNSKEMAEKIRVKIKYEEFINGEEKFVVDEDGVILEEVSMGKEDNI
jgi:integrase